jgi:hypothetical protein
MRFDFIPVGREFRVFVLGTMMPGHYVRTASTDFVNATRDGIPYHVNPDEWCVLVY